jgi:hypothetical protein
MYFPFNAVPTVQTIHIRMIAVSEPAKKKKKKMGLTWWRVDGHHFQYIRFLKGQCHEIFNLWVFSPINPT